MANIRETDATDTRASPRLFRRHQRYARFNRLNHSKQELEFLTVQATRLSTTVAKVFAALDAYTSDQIAGAATKGAVGIT